MANMEKGKKQSSIVKIMLAPVKALTKCMDDCTGGAVCPVPVERKKLINSSKEMGRKEGEVRDQLLRSVTKKRWSELDSCLELQKHCEVIKTGRNYSVRVGKIGRIDEDEPCCFEGDLIYPRSTSCPFY